MRSALGGIVKTGILRRLRFQQLRPEIHTGLAHRYALRGVLVSFFMFIARRTEIEGVVPRFSPFHVFHHNNRIPHYAIPETRTACILFIGENVNQISISQMAPLKPSRLNRFGSLRRRPVQELRLVVQKSIPKGVISRPS